MIKNIKQNTSSVILSISTDILFTSWSFASLSLTRSKISRLHRSFGINFSVVQMKVTQSLTRGTQPLLLIKKRKCLIQLIVHCQYIYIYIFFYSYYKTPVVCKDNRSQDEIPTLLKQSYTAIVFTSFLPTVAILFGSHCCPSSFSFFISSLVPLPTFEDRAWGQRRNWSDWEYLALVLAACCTRARELFAETSFTSTPFCSLTWCSSIPLSRPESTNPPLVPFSLSPPSLSIYSFHCEQPEKTDTHPKASSDEYCLVFLPEKANYACSLFSEKGACKALQNTTHDGWIRWPLSF